MTQTPSMPQKTSFLNRLFTRKPVIRKDLAHKQTLQPERPSLSHRERRDAWKKGGDPYIPIFFNLDVTGLNHRQRRFYYASRKGKVVEDGRRKKRTRGEYCGRKLDRLIRAGAPLNVVTRLRRQIRDFLDNQ